MWLSRDNSAPVAGARFIDPHVLARIGTVELISKTVVDGFISGLHRTPYLGLSMDFAEHRAYVPGDDVRRIDWRVYGRTDRLFVKEYQAESNANVLIILDISRSMDYGPGGISKLDYGRFLAASLGYLSWKQRDRVGLVTLDRDIVTFVPPSVKHFDRVLHELETARPQRAGELTAPLRQVAQNLRRRGIVVLISDLYIEPPALRDALMELQYRGHDVAVFHILDAAELQLPDSQARQFEDMESGERLPLVPQQVRGRYEEAILGHIDTLRRRLGEHGMDYDLFDTGKALDHALFQYLTGRQRRMNVR